MSTGGIEPVSPLFTDTSTQAAMQATDPAKFNQVMSQVNASNAADQQVPSLAALKEKDPKAYQSILMSMAQSIVRQMQKSEDRRKNQSKLYGF